VNKEGGSCEKPYDTICERFILAFLVGCLLFLFLRSGQSHIDGQDPPLKAPFQSSDKPGPENGYKFSEATPSGNWLAQADLDISQTHDPDVPVVLAGIRSYVGKGNWLKQLMIESVVLNSHTFQTVSAVKFGWIIISEEDFKAKKNLETARVRGY
jgi:hypothetical protein